MAITDIAIRFCAGGLLVSAFTLISDLLKPKTFAGLFGAAPSVALASLILTVMRTGKDTAVIESRSMIVGAVAFLLYAVTVSYIVLRFRRSALTVSLTLLLFWLGAASGLWVVFLGF